MPRIVAVQKCSRPRRIENWWLWDDLARIQQKAHRTPHFLDGHVSSHLVDASALRADDFQAFFCSRAEALLSAIGRAMGKSAQRAETEDEAGEIDDTVGEDET